MNLKQFNNCMKRVSKSLQKFVDERRVELEEKRYKETFSKEQTPDRERWEPRLVDRPWKINDRTGRLKRSRYISKDKITYTADYAVFVNAVRKLISEENDKQVMEQLKLDTVKFIRKNIK